MQLLTGTLRRWRKPGSLVRALLFGIGPPLLLGLYVVVVEEAELLGHCSLKEGHPGFFCSSSILALTALPLIGPIGFIYAILQSFAISGTEETNRLSLLKDEWFVIVFPAVFTLLTIVPMVGSGMVLVIAYPVQVIYLFFIRWGMQSSWLFQRRAKEPT
ncbi:MAG: hypothetical protein ACMVY4_09805 [Minwuia sp.]|uniref:hypothetical protein n=1 Tax=Minwuia sp. TaxID=2493630 RepID=UPI003A89A27F